MKKSLLFIAATITLLSLPNVIFGQAPNLGAAADFGLFTSIGAFNNSGATVVIGEVGTNAGAFSGFPPGTATVVHNVPDGVTAQAATDLGPAYLDLEGRICGGVIDVLLQNNSPLSPGTYCTGAAATLTGNLTLDGLGNPNSLFIIQIDGALATTIGSTITLINSASFCNVYWQISGQVALGDFSVFQGTIVGGGEIILYTGATLNGRGLTRAGAISSFSNKVNAPQCVPPIVTCPIAVAVSCANLISPPDLASVTAPDNCGGSAVITFVGDVITNQTCPNRYTVTRTYRATILCGATALCTQTITVDDQTLPTITCPVVISPILCPAVPVFPVATATDLCGGVPIITFMDVTVLNSVTRFWTATDDCGNASMCDRTITVTGNALPTITCPPSIVTDIDLNACTAVEIYADPTFTTSCSGVTISRVSGLPSGSAFPIGVNVVTWQAIDGVGNIALCNFTVTVNDTQLPTITCPSNLIRSMDLNLCTALVNYTPTVTDNCSPPLPTVMVQSGLPSGSNFPIGITVIVLKVTDSGGLTTTCSFQITVNDTQKPTITCPNNQNINTDLNLCTALVNYAPTVGDNCSPPLPTVMVQSGLPSGSNFPKGISVIVLKATDSGGLTKTCTFRVTVSDKQAPAIVCPLSIVTNTTLDQCDAIVTYTTPTFTDNCPGGSVVKQSGLASGSAFPKGVSTVVWKVTDASGNTKTCSFTVTVNDVQLPTITCPADIVQSTDPDHCNAAVVYAAAVATDNCTGVTALLYKGLASGSVFPLGTSNVVWKAIDKAGLSVTCLFKITVNDMQPPMIMCPSNTTVNGSGIPCGYPSANLLPATIMAENCANSQLTSNAPTTLLQGNTVITWTAIDAANNAAMCAYTVTVNCPAMRGGDDNDRAEKDVALIPGKILDLKIAPNPASSQVELRIQGVGEQGGELALFDHLGRMVWQESVTAAQVQISLDLIRLNLASGLYQVRLRTEHGILIKGLVINRV